LLIDNHKLFGGIVGMALLMKAFITKFSKTPQYASLELTEK